MPPPPKPEKLPAMAPKVNNPVVLGKTSKSATNPPPATNPQPATLAASSTATLTEKANKLRGELAQQSGRVVTGHQTARNQKMTIDLATSSAVEVDGLREIQNKQARDAEHRAEQNVKDKIATEEKLAATNEDVRGIEQQFLTNSESTNEEEIDAIKRNIQKDNDETLEDVVTIVRRLLKRNKDNLAVLRRKYKKGDNVAAAKKGMQEKHAAASAISDFRKQVQEYMKRKKEDYGMEKAREELAKVAANPAYLPDLPPGSFETWQCQEIWLQMAVKFLDLIKHNLGPIDDWPKAFINEKGERIKWVTGGLRDSMKKHLEPLYTNHVEVIGELGHVLDDTEKARFGNAIVALSNPTFIQYHGNVKAILNPSAYYLRFYTGILLLLRILKEMAANPAPEIDEGLPEIPAPQSARSNPLTKEKLMKHLSNRLSMLCDREDDDEVLLDLEEIFNLGTGERGEQGAVGKTIPKERTSERNGDDRRSGTAGHSGAVSEPSAGARARTRRGKTAPTASDRE